MFVLLKFIFYQMASFVRTDDKYTDKNTRNCIHQNEYVYIMKQPFEECVSRCHFGGAGGKVGFVSPCSYRVQIPPSRAVYIDSLDLLLVLNLAPNQNSLNVIELIMKSRYAAMKH